MLKIFNDIEISVIFTATDNFSKALEPCMELCASLQACCDELQKLPYKEEKTCE